jgi:hypothetical protein
MKTYTNHGAEIVLESAPPRRFLLTFLHREIKQGESHSDWMKAWLRHLVKDIASGLGLPDCHGSKPGPQAQAENCCHDCSHRVSCLLETRFRCPKCDGQGGRFDGDPGQGAERWVPCTCIRQ